MSSRVVIPELLDHLPPGDPEAVRSRGDLRRINSLMGNDRWICDSIRELPVAKRKSILEIGAGEGLLANRLAGLFPESEIGACDLVAAPRKLDPRVQWYEGDVFALPSSVAHGLLVANLFLHHFETHLLGKLGHWCGNFEALVFNEPDRARIPHLLGAAMHPFINSVTRHDMHVSIRAGFAEGELPRLLGLDRALWTIRETSTWRGSRRVIAWRG